MVTGPRIVLVCMGLDAAGQDVEWKEQQLTLRWGTDEPEAGGQAAAIPVPGGALGVM